MVCSKDNIRRDLYRDTWIVCVDTQSEVVFNKGSNLTPSTPPFPLGVMSPNRPSSFVGLRGDVLVDVVVDDHGPFFYRDYLPMLGDV